MKVSLQNLFYGIDQVLSEELSCHGIQSRPAVGYLSILESLRYCEVGDYYKSPLFPIWVVGSTSHFSVLFGDEVSAAGSFVILNVVQNAAISRWMFRFDVPRSNV